MPKPQYNGAHRVERERLRPAVEAGQANCANPRCVMPTRWIAPGDRWDLGHTADGKGYRGPEHSKCNQLEGARNGGRTIARRRHGLPATTTPHSMDW